MSLYTQSGLIICIFLATLDWIQSTTPAGNTAVNTPATSEGSSVSAGGSTLSMEESAKQVDKFANDLIKNDKIREIYINCLLDKIPCSQEADEIKKLVPEAVQKGCAKCTEVQQRIIEKMMLYLKDKQPEILEQVTKKFDPKGDLMKVFIGKLQQRAQFVANETRKAA